MGFEGEFRKGGIIIDGEQVEIGWTASHCAPWNGLVFANLNVMVIIPLYYSPSQTIIHHYRPQRMLFCLHLIQKVTDLDTRYVKASKGSREVHKRSVGGL